MRQKLCDHHIQLSLEVHRKAVLLRTRCVFEPLTSKKTSGEDFRRLGGRNRIRLRKQETVCQEARRETQH